MKLKQIKRTIGISLLVLGLFGSSSWAQDGSGKMIGYPLAIAAQQNRQALKTALEAAQSKAQKLDGFTELSTDQHCHIEIKKGQLDLEKQEVVWSYLHEEDITDSLNKTGEAASADLNLSTLVPDAEIPVGDTSLGEDLLVRFVARKHTDLKHDQVRISLDVVRLEKEPRFIGDSVVETLKPLSTIFGLAKIDSSKAVAMTLAKGSQVVKITGITIKPEVVVELACW